MFESALNVCPTLFLGDPNYAGLYKNCGGDFNKLLVAARKPPRAGNAPIFPSAPAGATQKPGTVSVSKVFLIIGGARQHPHKHKRQRPHSHPRQHQRQHPPPASG